MSVTFSVKMREALASRLAKAATAVGLAPDDLARLAVAGVVGEIEAHGKLRLPGRGDAAAACLLVDAVVDSLQQPANDTHKPEAAHEAAASHVTRRLLLNDLERLESGEIILHGPQGRRGASLHGKEVARG